jgi:peroxiredoxin-like protein
MAHLKHLSNKSKKQFLYEVQLNWLEKSCGILHSGDVVGAIQVAAPANFGGEGKDWSPEHLFLSSVSSCYMTTYLSFAKKMDFEIAGFECNAIGQVDLVDGKYKFTHINVYPEIYIADESVSAKASLAVQKTEKYCLIGNSVNATIIYHSEVLIESQKVPSINAGAALKNQNYGHTG